MEQQTLTHTTPVWASFGLVILTVLFGVVVAAIKDARQAKATANATSE